MRPGTARSRRCSARRNGSRTTTRICASTPWRTSTPTAPGRGFFNPSGSHSLEQIVNGVAQRRRGSGHEADASGSARRRAAIASGSREERTEARSRTDLRIAALGSGSDYSSFLQHNGVPSLESASAASTTTTASTTRFTTTTITSRNSSTPTSPTGGRSRRSPAR